MLSSLPPTARSLKKFKVQPMQYFHHQASCKSKCPKYPLPCLCDTDLLSLDHVKHRTLPPHTGSVCKSLSTL